MKKFFLLPVVILSFLLSSCKLEQNAYYDDVYTTTIDRQYVENTPHQNVNNADPKLVYSESETVYDDNGNPVQTNNYYYYDEDNYYDYAYAARIRRFHTEVSLGFGYYDPCFTNLYWYDPCYPNFGVSIYLGYNWCWPSVYYRPYYTAWGGCSCGFSYSWGWGGCRCGGYWGPGWGGRCYGCGYYGSPNYWYNRGYNDGFYAGYYHNNYDRNHSFNYGHRDNARGSNGYAMKERGRAPSDMNGQISGGSYGGGGAAGSGGIAPFDYTGTGLYAGSAGTRANSPSSSGSFSEHYESLVASKDSRVDISHITPVGTAVSSEKVIPNGISSATETVQPDLTPIGGGANTGAQKPSTTIERPYTPAANKTPNGSNDPNSVRRPAGNDNSQPVVNPYSSQGGNSINGLHEQRGSSQSDAKPGKPNSTSNSTPTTPSTPSTPNSSARPTPTPTNPSAGSSNNAAKPASPSYSKPAANKTPNSSNNPNPVQKPAGNDNRRPEVSPYSSHGESSINGSYEKRVSSQSNAKPSMPNSQSAPSTPSSSARPAPTPTNPSTGSSNNAAKPSSPSYNRPSAPSSVPVNGGHQGNPSRPGNSYSTPTQNYNNSSKPTPSSSNSSSSASSTYNRYNNNSVNSNNNSSRQSRSSSSSPSSYDRSSRSSSSSYNNSSRPSSSPSYNSYSGSSRSSGSSYSGSSRGSYGGGYSGGGSRGNAPRR